MKSIIKLIVGMLVMIHHLPAQVSAVYGGGPFYDGGQTVIDDVRASGFNTVILWSLHVDTDGTFFFNDKKIIDENGAYVGDPDWPKNLASLLEQPTYVDRIELSVGAGGTTDFENMQLMIDRDGTGPETPLYKGYKTILETLPLDVINYNDESDYDAESMIALSYMLVEMGYKIAFVPFTFPSFWGNVYGTVEDSIPGAIDRIYIQAYAGGTGNQPAFWNNFFGDLKVIPGLWSKHNGCSLGDSPEVVMDKLSVWKDDISGGFMWIYDDIRDCSAAGRTTVDYARVINEVAGIPSGPLPASDPQPLPELASISRSADIRWTPGDGTSSSDLYFGTTNPPPFIGNINLNLYDPGTLEENTTYYWRADGVNQNGTTLGTTWRFQTARTSPHEAYATLPYSTSFETGVLDEYWSVTIEHLGARVRILESNGPNTGKFHMLSDMDTDLITVTNEILLHLDLGDVDEALLRFYWKEFADETDPEDGIYISDDVGVTYAKIFDLKNNGTDKYKLHEFDLVALAADNGMELTEKFIVKFQHRDNERIANDGFAFDDISVTEGGVVSVKDQFGADDGLVSYPNPFETHLTIDISALRSGAMDLILYDLSGQPVYHQSLIDASGDTRKVVLIEEVQDLSSGIYELVLMSADGMVSRTSLVKK